MSMELARTDYIGASEAAAVVGLSRWGTPVSVWSRKVGLAPDEEPSALRLRLGKMMEPILLTLYAEQAGREPRRHQRLVLSKDHPFIGAHPDYQRLEVKTSRSEQGWGETGQVITPDDPTGIPLDYYLQVQQQMYVTGWDWEDVAVLIGHDEFRVLRVERAPAVIDDLVNAEVEFWHNFVLTRTPPPMDESDAAREYLRAKFPREREPLRVATPEEAELLREAWSARKLAADAERDADRLAARLKAAIGDASGLTDGMFRATWTAADRRTIEADRVRALLTPDQLAQVEKVTTVRTLRFATGKDA